MSSPINLPAALRFAETISQGEPFERLDETVRDFLGILAGNVELDEGDPALGREEVRANLAKLSESARFILEQLRAEQRYAPKANDPRRFPMREFLMSDAENDLPFMRELTVSLRFLAGRCDEKKTALLTSRGGLKPQPDIVSAKLPDGQSLCALMVMVLWERRTGKPPGVNNPEAQKACAQLWEAAGGLRRENTRTNLEDRSYTSWRRSLETARDRWLTSTQAETLRTIGRAEY